MKMEVKTSPKRSSTKRVIDKFRVSIDPETWSEKKLGDTIDLTGKKLHLFQLPPDMPVECLNGVEMPTPGKKKWSKPVTVRYTTNEGKTNEQKHDVTIRAQKIVADETLLQVCGGELIASVNQPLSLFQGFEVEEHPSIVLPDTEETVHQLPAGLRQRFTPIGNGIVQSRQGSSVVPVTPKVTSSRNTKHKSANKRKSQTDAELRESPTKRKTKSDNSDVTEVVESPKKKRKR